MKKLFSLFLSLILAGVCAFSLLACDNGNPPDTGKEEPPVIEPPVVDPPDPPVVDNESFLYRAVEEDGKTVSYAVQGAKSEDTAKLTIPSAYNGLPVTAIDGGAFDSCGWLTSVTIPNSIKSIGANAFARCENLSSVFIDSIEAWCNISFESMASNPLYFAGELYVSGSIVTNLVIPDSVTQIPDYAFYECKNIKSVTTGKGVKEIGESAFYNCEQLEKIVLNGNIESFGLLAFGHCEALTDLQIGNGVKSLGDYTFYECSYLKEVTIPSSVKTIGESCFSMCSRLDKINFNEGLEYIGDCAFVGCASLTEFIMPDSVTEIGFGILMFVGNFMFDSGVADGQNGITKVGISNSLTVISQFSFSGCFMPTVAIGKSVEVIDYSAFYDCSALESVIISKSVKQIVSYAFYHCYFLNTVYYEGSEAEFKDIKISKSGNDILNADIYYYSESKPADGGKFWHYAPDGVTPEKW